MTGGFDPGRYTAAPLQTEGVIRFTGSPDAVFARIANHGALTDWVPMLKTVQVSHPSPCHLVRARSEPRGYWRCAEV